MNRDRGRLRARVRQGTTWYKVSNLAGDGGPAEISIYDEIGWFGVSASEFLAELKAVTASDISLRLSSPGGEVQDGFAIFEALRTHRARVTVHVDSLAASIASVIAMAGDRIIVGKFAEFMVHDAMTVSVGNAAEMREVADHLDRESDRIAGVYAERAGGTVRQWRSRMAVETWFSATEAVEAGLADEIAKPAVQEEHDLAARWDLSVFAHAGRSAAPAPDLSRPKPAPAPPVPPTSAPVPEVVNAVEPTPAPEPVEDPVPVAIDPEVFRAAMQAAAGGFEFDAVSFREALTALAGDAPAVPAPTPEPEPEQEPAPAPEPEREPGIGEVLHEVVSTLAADAPAVPPPSLPSQEPDPAPEPRPAEPEPGPPEVSLAEIFRAAVELEATRMSAPAASPEPVDEPDLYDPCVMTRALKEAIK